MILSPFIREWAFVNYKCILKGDNWECFLVNPIKWSYQQPTEKNKATRG